MKRAKKRVIARNTKKLQKQSIAAAAKSNIALPKFSPMPVAKSNRGAISVDLDSRSDKMESALENMLKNPLRTRSRELSQALNQKSSKTNHNLPEIAGKSQINIPSKSTNKSVIHSSTTITQPNNKRRSRESAARTQNQLDIDRNYQKWSTEYKGSREFSEEIDYLDSGGED